MIAESVSDHDSEEVKSLKWIIQRLRANLRSAEEEREEALYRKDVAEWACVGVAMHHAHITTTVQDQVFLSAHASVKEIVDEVARKTGLWMLREARCAFDKHAELGEALMHIVYLENHALTQGVKFTPYAEKQSQGYMHPTKLASKWVRPTHFGGPVA